MYIVELVCTISSTPNCHDQVVCVLFVYNRLLQGPNIALNKVTEQHPGVYATGTSDKAVDGKTGKPMTYTINECSHTDWNTSTPEAWWRVDLGDTYRLTGIKIYNRDQARMFMFQLY